MSDEKTTPVEKTKEQQLQEEVEQLKVELAASKKHVFYLHEALHVASDEFNSAERTAKRKQREYDEEEAERAERGRVFTKKARRHVRETVTRYLQDARGILISDLTALIEDFEA